MIYAYDSAIQLPVRDIYDTQLMMASINAARDMYERGQKQMEDFYKSYGDFFSPIASDMDWYDTNVTGAARNFINEMYKNGVDPLRSAEGRSLVQQFVNNIPVGEINKRKQAAAAAQEYIKARGQLEAKGLWNPDYESYLLGGRSLETWDTSRDGLWTRTSPGEFSDLNAATTAWFNQLEPSYLRTQDGYDYIGISPDAIQKVMTSQIPGFIDSNLGGYHYELARRQLVAQGNTNPTQAEIVNQLRNNIQAANSEVLRETRTMNPEYKMNLELEQYKKKAAIDDYYDKLKEDRKAARAAAATSTATGGEDVAGHNWDQQLYASVISNITGNTTPWYRMTADDYNLADITARMNAHSWATDVINPRKYNNEAYRDQFMQRYTIQVDPQTLIKRSPRNTNGLVDPNQFHPSSVDIDKLISMDDLLRNTEGFDSKKLPGGVKTKHLRDRIREVGPNRVVIDVQDSVYGAPLKNATNIVPRQVVIVKILSDEDVPKVEETFEAGYIVGPDSRGMEMMTMPETGYTPGTERIFSKSVFLKPQKVVPPLNTVPNIYNSTNTGLGNRAISYALGDAQQGVKYNGITPLYGDN